MKPHTIRSTFLFPSSRVYACDSPPSSPPLKVSGPSHLWTIAINNRQNMNRHKNRNKHLTRTQIAIYRRKLEQLAGPGARSAHNQDISRQNAFLHSSPLTPRHIRAHHMLVVQVKCHPLHQQDVWSCYQLAVNDLLRPVWLWQTEGFVSSPFDLVWERWGSPHSKCIFEMDQMN